MDDLILIRQRDALFEIILNRPGKRNAINLEMFRAFDAAVTQANRTPGLRAVLIRGEGESFSAGIDVSTLLGLAESHGLAGERVERTEQFEPALRAALARPGSTLIEIALSEQVITTRTTLEAIENRGGQR